MEIAYTKTTLANGLDVILHEDHTLPIVAVNVWYHVGSKDERPGSDRLRAPVRAPDVRGLGQPRFRLLPAAAGRRRGGQRLDQRRSHQLLGSGADRGARARAVPRVRPHGVPAAGADREEVHHPARGGDQRAAAELREPALRARRHRDGDGALPGAAPVPLADHRLHARSARRHARRRPRLLRAALPPGQRLARARRRHRSGAGARAGRALLRRLAGRTAGAGAYAVPAEGLSGETADRPRGSRRSAAALPRVADAGAVRRGRRRPRRRRRRHRQRQDLAPLSHAGARAAPRARRLGCAAVARARGLLPARRHRRSGPHAGGASTR